MPGIRKLAVVVLAVLICTGMSLSAGTVGKEINDVKIVTEQGSVRIEIGSVGEINFDAFTMSGPDRLVVDCVGARNDLRWSEKEINSLLVSRVRTSQYKVNPMLVSRIVLDLNKKVDYRDWRNGDYYIVEITERGAVPAADRSVLPVTTKVSDTDSPDVRANRTGDVTAASMGPVLPVIKPFEETPDESKQDSGGSMPVEERSSAESSPWVAAAPVKDGPGMNEREKVTRQAEQTTIPAPTPPVYYNKAEEVLPWTDSYMRGAPAGGAGTGMGSRRITLDAQGADIKTVLRTISDFAGINIVAGSDVKGEVFVHIKDSPWEEALDILLKAHGYGYRDEFGMIRVAEIKKLTKEEIEIQSSERKKEDLQPLFTEIIFVNNSDADELRTALQNVVSDRGRIDVDKGSNAIIISDIEKNIEKIKEMVQVLDQKFVQVDISAKIVEVDVEAKRELGIDWGLFSVHASGLSGTGRAQVTTGISESAGNVMFGTVRSWGELNVVLEALERANKANIISNPRITTLDNREATILVGKEIPLIVADEAGNPITELTKIGIMLRVTPHVNADRTITLDLHPEVSELQSEATAQGGVIIATSEADTRVIVKDGETAVIGGLIKKVETEVRTGIPILMDIPFLGAIFSSQSTAEKKQELVIFVTPTIVE